jgi:hypothetical protein
MRRARLLGRLGDVAFAIDREKSISYLESSIALFESIGRFDKTASMHVGLGFSFATVAQPQYNGARAIEHFRRRSGHSRILRWFRPTPNIRARLFEQLA